MVAPTKRKNPVRSTTAVVAAASITVAPRIPAPSRSTTIAQVASIRLHLDIARINTGERTDIARTNIGRRMDPVHRTSTKRKMDTAQINTEIRMGIDRINTGKRMGIHLAPVTSIESTVRVRMEHPRKN